MDTLLCISNKIWEEYSEGKLHESDLKGLVAHAASCEICSDIKEGIDGMKTPKDLPERINAIHLKVDEYLHPKPHRSFLFWYSSAAAIFLIAVGLSWVLINNSKKQEVVNTIKQAEKIDSVNIAHSTSPEHPKLLEDKNAPPLSLNVTPSKPENPGMEDQQLGALENDDAPKDQAGDESKKMIVEENKTTSTYTAAGSASEDVEIGSSDKALKEREVKTVESIAMVETSKRSRNAKFMKRKTESAPTVYNNNRGDNSSGGILNLSDSVYYSHALTSFKSKLYDDCLSNLNPIIQNSNSEFYEDGLILNAETFIALHKDVEAKALLNRVISFNRKRVDDAKRLLGSMK